MLAMVETARVLPALCLLILGSCLGLDFSFFTCLMVAHKCDGTPGMIWAFFLFREPRHGAYHQVEELKVSFGSVKQ